MNAQQAESLKRAAILLGAMLLPGVIAVYPQLLGDAPLDVHAMIRAFIAAIVGGVISRYGEGIYDGRRAATGDVIKGDVTSPADAPALVAPPITAATLGDFFAAVDVLRQWQRPVEQPLVTISGPATGGFSVTNTTGPFAPPPPVKRSHHAAKVPVATPLETVSDH